MTNLNQIVNHFLEGEIDFARFEQSLLAAISSGNRIEDVKQHLDNPKLKSVLSYSQFESLTQKLDKLSDKTVVDSPASPPELIAEDEGVDDQTVLSFNSGPVSSDDEQTQVAPHLSQENTTTDDDATLLANPPNTFDDDATVVANSSNQFAEEDTVFDDKTRIQPKPPIYQNTDPDATITAPPVNTEQVIVKKKLEPGRIINNRFVLEKLLGQGGMGSVFKARDLRKEEANDSNSHIAIKFLNEDFKQHPQALMSLQREAKKSQTLAHPNIITVHDFDRDGDTVYMTMEYLDGSPLDDYLVDHKNTGIEKDVAIKIIDDIAQALSYAHQKNIVHSDFKPGNVFITKDGTAKILDFGIARAVKGMGEKATDSSSDKTHFDAGDLGGLTPTYASCEMLEGKQPSPSDDMYALGCVAYELFTGSHPFLKTPATRARDQGLVPGIIKELDKKQANALLHTLQYSMQDRTEDAQTFIREFFIRKQSSKGLLATLAVAAILLIGVGIKFFLDFQQQIAVEELIITIQQGDNADIAKSIPQLNELEGETRETVLSEVRSKVLRYYAAKALPLADQSKGQYNFPKALAVLANAKKLYPDSAQLNELIVQLVNSQNQLLNTLSLQIDKYLQKGKLTSAIYNNDIQDIIDLLNIAAPDSHLLKDPRIQLAYVREIKSAFKSDKLEDATLLITSALKLFKDDKEILAMQKDLKARELQVIEDQQLLTLQKQLREEGSKISDAVRKKALKRHTEKLTALLKEGFRTESWPNEVQSEIVALDVFARNKTEKQLDLRDKAATLIVQSARKSRREGELNEARNLLKQASKIAPKLSSLQREKRALVVAERKQQQTHASKEKTAKIATLRQSLLNQAKANDVKSASKTLQSLTKLDPNSRFVKTEAPEAIANAYLTLAKGLAKRQEFDSALNLTEAGIKIAPKYIAVRNAKNEYQAEIAIISLNKSLENFDSISIKKSKKLLKTIKRGLPDRFSTVQHNTSNMFLERIKTLAQSDQDRAKILIDIAQKIFPENREIAALTKRSSKFQSAGGQPCKSSYAGHGNRKRATCFDMISDDIKAPLMVVIPPVTRDKAIFAISKYEISIKDYNIYCEQSGECSARNNIDDALPMTNINIKNINKYLGWLSMNTREVYRLPTDQEWLHAANAGGDQPKKDVNCRLMLGSQQIKGIDLLDVKSGKQNGWGLKNYIGNAQELVTSGSNYNVRGGAYTDSFSQCDITLKRSHSGGRDDVTGFRIIKVL